LISTLLHSSSQQYTTCILYSTIVKNLHFQLAIHNFVASVILKKRFDLLLISKNHSFHRRSRALGTRVASRAEKRLCINYRGKLSVHPQAEHVVNF